MSAATSNAGSLAPQVAHTRESKKWHAVEAALLKHHCQPDRQAARTLYAAIAAHRLARASCLADVSGPARLSSIKVGRAALRFDPNYIAEYIKANTRPARRP